MPDIPVHGRVAANGGQRVAQPRQIAVFQQALAQLALFAGRRVFQHVFKAAVLGNQAQGGLFAHAGHAGDVVGSVAHQSFYVDELFGRYAIRLLNPGGRYALCFRDAAPGIQYGGVVPGKLERIPVASDQQRLYAAFLALAGERAEDIVGLKTLALDDGKPHVGKQVADDWVLPAQLFGHGLAVGLVFGVEVGAEGMLAHVEGHCRRRGRFLIQHAQKHHHKAVHGIGGRAVGRGHGRGKGVKGAIHQAVSVQQNQLFSHGQPSRTRGICPHADIMVILYHFPRKRNRHSVASL